MRVGMLGTVDHISLFAPEAAESADVDFVGIAEPEEARGKPLAEKHSTRLYTTTEALLSEKLDAVGVFTPFHSRADDIVTCLEAGLHVFTDKPAATNARGLARISKALGARPELVFTMGLTLRVTPEYMKVKELVDGGFVGKVVQINARRAYRLRRATRPQFMFDSSLSGGIWVELAVHDVDCIRWITAAEYLSVTATHGNISSPTEPYQDHGSGLFVMERGITVFVEHNRLVPGVGDGSDNRLHIVGSQGLIDLGPGSELSAWNGTQGRAVVTDLPARPSMFRNFVSAVTRGEALIAPARDVLRATEAVLAAFSSAEKGGRREKLA